MKICEMIGISNAMYTVSVYNIIEVATQIIKQISLIFFSEIISLFCLFIISNFKIMDSILCISYLFTLHSGILLSELILRRHWWGTLVLGYY